MPAALLLVLKKKGDSPEWLLERLEVVSQSMILSGHDSVSRVRLLPDQPSVDRRDASSQSLVP
jgi:hypothetical protein